MRDTQREAETQAEGEAGTLKGSPMWDSIQDPESCPELKADAQLLSHPGVPPVEGFKQGNVILFFKGPICYLMETGC